VSVPRTVELGQYLDERAEAIAARLDDAGIAYWVKRSGGLTRLLSAGDWGTRVFVDADRLEEARRLAAHETDG
jgi:hypothetical protein